MLFILKKKKKKRKRKMLVTKEEKKKKTQLTNPFCAKLERKRRTTGRFWKQGAPVFEELYELFKDYFHMAASDIEEFAVRDT